MSYKCSKVNAGFGSIADVRTQSEHQESGRASSRF